MAGVAAAQEERRRRGRVAEDHLRQGNPLGGPVAAKLEVLGGVDDFLKLRVGAKVEIGMGPVAVIVKVADVARGGPFLPPLPQKIADLARHRGDGLGGQIGWLGFISGSSGSQSGENNQ